MKQFQGRARFYASAATIAVVAGWTSPTAAQCVTDATTVTCSGTVTSGAVNTAVNGVAPPSVTVRIAADATVTRTAAAVQPNSIFTGAVDIGNNGTLGTLAAPVGVTYFGSPAVVTNTFNLTNGGLITGGVNVSGVGGPITVTNTGTLAGGLQLAGSGAITLTSSGPIYVAGGTAGVNAVSLQSQRFTSTTTGTAGVDALTTSTVTGGAVAATITAPVAIPAAADGTVTPQGILISSAGTGSSVRLSLDAAAGAVQVRTFGTDSVFTPGNNVTVANGVTTTRSSNAQTQNGGAASATLGSNAQVANLTVQSGPGGATASIAGGVGTAAAPGFVSVNSSVINTTNTTETVSSATGSTTRSTGSTTPVGGAAAVDIAATGRVVGNVNVASNAGSATAAVAGSVGAINGTTAIIGNVVADSRGSRSTFDNSNTAAGAASSFSNASTQTGSTGIAAASVASTGRVLGSVTATASSGAATTTIAGQVGQSDGTIVIGNAVADSRTTNSSQTGTNATAANGNFTSSSNSTQTSAGGAAATTVASTGSVAGSVNAVSNAGDATVSVAGLVGAGTGTAVTVQGNVLADSRGINSTQANSSSNVPGNGDFANSQRTVQSVSGGAASATIASTGAVFGNVTVLGDRSATIDNAARVRDFAQATSSRGVTLLSESSNSRVTTAGADGASTVVTRNAGATTTQTSGGTAALTNRAGGVIEDGAFVSGVGGVSFTNAGAIFNNVSVTSQGTRSENTNTFTGTVTTTPATAGGATVRNETASTSTSLSAPVGGTATGTYGGTIGAAQGSSLAAATQVSQTGQAGSTATIGGVLYADVVTAAGATRSEGSTGNTSLTVTQPATGTATPAVETSGTSTSRSANTVVAGNNVVSVTGSLRNNGFGTGDLTAISTGGATAVTIDGGIVDGGVTAQSNASTTVASGNDSSFRNTQAATAAGPAAALVQQLSNSSGFSEQRRATGSASVALTGNARVGGSIQVNGTGTGAGTTGASATVASTATVGGTVSVATGGGADFRNDTSSVATRTAATATTRTNRFSTVSTRPTNAGAATASVAGTVGGLFVSAPFDNASATLSGQVLNGGGVTVTALGSLNSNSSEQTYRGTSATTLDTPIQTGSTSQNSSTATGGTATLTIASAGTTATNSLSAVNGSIQVSGNGGSALTIGAGTRVLATNAGTVYVGSSGANTASTFTATFNATGGQTGTTNTFGSTAVGGAATLTNAGIIGASVGYLGAPIDVTATSVGGASVTNSGTIYGTVEADALYSNVSQTTTATGLLDAVTQQTVTVSTTTLVGGAGNVTNTGVISGNVSLAGATGTLANSGVLRNGATLGLASFAGTQTTTQNATVNTTTLTAPTTRFVQSYTLNQNGLLLNGINVTGVTVADFSSNAAANALLRTSDVRAVVNLNGGSATTGNIVAEVDRANANARLTDTTVNLVGAGYLGVGTGLTPPASLGVGAAALRYENTPNFAGFAAIDPALGSTASGTFVPSVGIASGSRITGVNLVDRSGAGVFTYVGTAFQSASNANPTAAYTMDVGTLRLTSGELQLGVAGTDPANGAAVFAIRGNVVNNGGTLVLGRRVTDGTTSVVQGTNLRVDGNFTQAAGGTLALAATPALVRIAGTQVGALLAEGIIGFGGYGVALSPFVPFDPTATNQLRSTPSTLTVNGNLTLAGAVTVAAQSGAIYTAGRNADLITVNGTYNGTGLTVSSPMNSPFVRFVLTPRTVGSQTIVSVDVARTSYASVTSTSNAAAAATALDAAVPSVVAQLRAIPNPNSVRDVESYGYVQDLATVISALDTRLTASEATAAFDQLGSGSVYGSLAAVTTTAAFGSPSDAGVLGDAGIGLWLRPSGLFSRFDGDGITGAGRLHADNYGGAAGIGISTGEGGAFGIGGGYARVDAHDRRFGSKADADTYMVGAFGRQLYRGFDLSAQLVFGWSNWDVTRPLPLFSRTATARIDSKEIRLTARVGYDLAFNGLTVTPFGRLDLRRYDFESIRERDAGGIGLFVRGRQARVWNPEAGLRISGDTHGVRPFAEASYVFQGNVKGARLASFLGDTANSFRLEGVDPDGYARIGGGLSADAYGANFSLRGSYLTGGGNKAGEVLGSITFRF